ncbi:hypothetical protein HDV06_003211 [Boothiomyces sp. JEL0866]|nr:hypothetical protein HDV06_003211 [Boothiomyces sp. JEL0866]
MNENGGLVGVSSSMDLDIAQNPSLNSVDSSNPVPPPDERLIVFRELNPRESTWQSAENFNNQINSQSIPGIPNLDRFINTSSRSANGGMFDARMSQNSSTGRQSRTLVDYQYPNQIHIPTASNEEALRRIQELEAEVANLQSRVGDNIPVWETNITISEGQPARPKKIPDSIWERFNNNRGTHIKLDFKQFFTSITTGVAWPPISHYSAWILMSVANPDRLGVDVEGLSTVFKFMMELSQYFGNRAKIAVDQNFRDIFAKRLGFNSIHTKQLLARYGKPTNLTWDQVVQIAAILKARKRAFHEYARDGQDVEIDIEVLLDIISLLP